MATNTTFKDYSDAIVIPSEIPEHLEAHYTALKRAKRVIHILSLSTQNVKTFSYDILHGAREKMVLPSQYQFWDFQIRFLPGWWNYIVVLRDGVEISLKIPHGKDEFESDLKLIKTFLTNYYSLPLQETPYRETRQAHHTRSQNPEIHVPITKRQQALILFKKALQEQGRCLA